MSRQYNKVEKRNRAKAYMKRVKERAMAAKAAKGKKPKAAAPAAAKA